MLDLIPTLFAQQQVKPTAIPEPIEPASVTQAKPTTPVVTPTPAIATPEPTPALIHEPPAPVSIAPTPAPIVVNTVPVQSASVVAPSAQQTASPQPIGSTIVLPQVPIPKPTEKVSTSAKPIEKPAASTTSRPVAADSTIPAIAPSPTSRNAIEIPVPKPQATSESPTQQQKQQLEQRLADIVNRDRVAKQAQQRETIVSRAYSLATQRQFAQARKLLQDPSVPTDVREQILSNINSLESASRAIGVTQVKEPVKKPTTIAKKPVLKSPAVFTGISSRPVRSPQKVVTIQVPRAIQSLPIQRKALVSDPTVSVASDSIGGYVDQLGTPKNDPLNTPKNLQAYNRNLPKLNSRDQIVYPLPEPVPVTSGFGWRRHPVTGVRRFHAGVDLGAGQGTPVIASRGGKVVTADRMGGYGLAIVLQQPDGSQDTLYAHLSQIFVRPGEKIQAGTIIGRVGSTGLSTGPHLHYEARRKTNSGLTPVDPGGQLEAAKVRLVQARQTDMQSAKPRGNSWQQSASITRSQYIE